VLNTTLSGKTHFLYNEENDVIAETSAATGASFREYIWLPGEGIGGGGKPIAVIDAANTASPKIYWIATDHLDRPVLMTDTTRTIVWRAAYKPFGEVISLTGPAATDANLGTQRFPGQWFQLETGLAYNWHRHYDASLGRYTQVDPSGLPVLLSDGPSVFGYAGQMPSQTVDRNGLDYYIPRNLGDQLLLEDCMNGGGEIIMGPMSFPKGGRKYQNSQGGRTIHYMCIGGICGDYKFKE
jgi:RHS repeat-associated protein